MTGINGSPILCFYSIWLFSYINGNKKFNPGRDQLFHISASLMKNCQSAALSVRISVCYLPMTNDIVPSINKTFNSPCASGNQSLKSVQISHYFLSPLTQDMKCDVGCVIKIQWKERIIVSHTWNNRIWIQTCWKSTGSLGRKLTSAADFLGGKNLDAWHQWCFWLRNIQFTNEFTATIG